MNAETVIRLEERRASEFRLYAERATSAAYRQLWIDRAVETEHTVARMREAAQAPQEASA